MKNNWQEISELIWLYSPIGVIGVWRWGVWLTKKFLTFFYHSPRGNLKASLSVVTPVYNEDPMMFRRALNSWKRNRVNEIIAVIDYTDKENIKVFKDFTKQLVNKNRAKLYITERPGKREALEDGVEIARGKIVALVDSDTVWGSGIKDKLTGPFENEKVGGVAPRQDVLKADTLARKLFKFHLHNRFYNELNFLAGTGSGLTCLSGRTAVYRRKAIKNLMGDLVQEKFMGEKCISGDDKYLSHLVMSQGWKVLYLKNILVKTPGSAKMGNFIKQLVRWTRNSWRADIKSIFSGWIWKQRLLALHTLDRFIQPFVLILGPIFLIIAMAKGHWLVVLIILGWWFFSRGVKMIELIIRNPGLIFILPLYIAMNYFMSLIKFYTLLTIGRQSWVTRWDKSRLFKIGMLRVIYPYVGSLWIVALMTFFVLSYTGLFESKQQQAQKLASMRKQAGVEVNSMDKISFLSETDLENKKQQLLKQIKQDRYGYYQLKPKDSLEIIKQKFNIAADEQVLNQDKTQAVSAYTVLTGTRVAIPIDDLRQPLQKENFVNNVALLYTYNQANNTISIKGRGGWVTIGDIAQRFSQENLIENLGQGQWLLKANLDLEDDVILVIDGEEVNWLKMQSNQEKFVWIKSDRGSILIKATKITSWDDQNNDFDYIPEDGRSYILQKNSGRMDILDSEIAYLGHLGLPTRGKPFGGPYGIGWKIDDNSLHHNLVTGVVAGNSIHDNYFGFYTYGATGMLIKNNHFYNNIEYGIDPHDDSNNLLIEDNHVHDNGNHGIITSKRCYNNIIRNNQSVDNRLHGIMLDRQSNNNLVMDNFISGNVDGVAVYDSHSNVVVDNMIKNNKSGTRLNKKSSDNYFQNNHYLNNDKALYAYKNTRDNYFDSNIFEQNSIILDQEDQSRSIFSNIYKQELFLIPEENQEN
ncbi:MAG: glycosyltransferase [Candidatus Moranbacteria bacterium]|nr:glycosyltransferase [Candidatus Moranbacteria bacterium]